jgi:hypothetical protein
LQAVEAARGMENEENQTKINGNERNTDNNFLKQAQEGIAKLYTVRFYHFTFLGQILRVNLRENSSRHQKL